jgi:hypothetical protein
MRAATQLALLLMGGGALSAGAASVQSGRACRKAQARHDPQAAAVCRQHGSWFHGPHVWSGGWFGSAH